ncbi:hypothetical protein JHK84_047722 [Glycine max]|nr:hypothetical protein JHK86_047698 [Glycine max]KAG4943668.1 hypothetical protein JHK85_048314 [Glycine max]KAG5102753.1 hypothetical protein JHK84_047722 [Glycine max]
MHLFLKFTIWSSFWVLSAIRVDFYRCCGIKRESSRIRSRRGPRTHGGGATHWFPKEPGQGSCSGHGITFRSSRDPRHKFWEITNNASLCLSSKRSVDNVLSTPSHARSMINGEKPYSKEQCHDDNNKKKNNYERESFSSKRHIDDVLSNPSHTHSMNTREKLNSREQWHHNNKKKNYEREDSLGWKPLNKGNNTFERFYSQSTGKGRDKNKNIVETVVNNVIEETRGQG